MLRLLLVVHSLSGKVWAEGHSRAGFYFVLTAFWICAVAAAFTNSTAGSDFVSHNGRWLDDPVVVLRANATSALLQLASPMYNVAAKTVTFQVCTHETSSRRRTSTGTCSLSLVNQHPGSERCTP